MSLPRVYRKYQVEIHGFLKAATSHSGVEAPTGCGKTTQIVGFVGYAKLRKLWKRVLIPTTQQQIEEAILHRDYDTVQIGSVRVPVPDDLIMTARGSSRGTRAEVERFLTGTGFAMACTHSTLTGFSEDRLPGDLTGYLLIVDEGHHMPADGFSKFEKAWVARGGTVFVFTATGYRSDGRKVGSESMCWSIRSMAQHMEEGFAPRNLKYGVRAITGKGKVSYEQFTGSKAPPKTLVGDIARSAVEEWRKLGKPKTIVQIPPVSGGSAAIVKKVVDAFEAEGMRVVDATGLETKKKKDFLDFIRRESKKRWKDSEADVVVGCQRVVEGTDWPACELVIRVGIPGSVTMIVQLTGRAMRKKDETCPARRREMANVVFLVPAGNGDVMRKMSMDHSRAILMISCFMSDSQTGQKWLLEKELKRFKRKVTPEDPSGRATVMVQMAAVRRKAADEGRELTLGGLIKETRKKLPDADPETVKKIALEILNKQDGGKSVRAAVKKVHVGVNKDVRRVLDELVEEFRDVTLIGTGDSMEVLGRQVHALTGGSISEWAERVAGSMPLTEEQVIKRVESWRKDHGGEWPVNKSGQIPGTTDSWAAVDQALVKGTRGLPGGSSLAKLMERIGHRNVGNRPRLSEDKIFKQLLSWKKETKEFPSSKSKEMVPGTTDSWQQVDRALVQGLRGLPGGSSLAKLMERIGHRNAKNLPRLSEDKIFKHILSWKKETKEFPSSKSKEMVPGTVDSWRSFDVALVHGLRGLSGGSSLVKLMEKAGRKNIGNQPRLSEDTIVRLARAWKRSHEGRRPGRHTSGTIPGTGDGWMSMENALVKGLRGLPGGSSLAKLLDKHGI